MKRCPYCGEEILEVAKKCKHCGEWLPKTPQKIQCPFCGEEIIDTVKKCKHCGEWLTGKSTKLNNKQNEIDTKSYLPKFNRMPTIEFVAICIFTFGLFKFYWYFQNLRIFNELSTQKYKNNVLFGSYTVCTVLYWVISGVWELYIPNKAEYMFEYGINDYSTHYNNAAMQYLSSGDWIYPASLLLLCCIISGIVYLILNYNLLKIIEEYAYKTTQKRIKHNCFAWFFFGVCYVNFAINSYKERIEGYRYD